MKLRLTGFRDVLGITTGQPSNVPSCADGFAVDERLSKSDAAPADRWDLDLKKAFTTFKKKGKKHRDAELTRMLAKLLIGGDADSSEFLELKSGAAIRKVWTPTADNLFKRVSGPMMEGIYCQLLDLGPTDERAKALPRS